MAGQTLDRVPNILGLYAKAAFASLPLVGRESAASGGGDLADLRLGLADVEISRDQVARYADVCGFAAGAHVPATYPQVVAFPLHLALMTDARFPFPAVGVVHIANTITQHRLVGIDEPLSFDVRVSDLQPHARGRQLTLHTECRTDQELVWQGETVVLHREETSPGTTAADGPAVPEQAPQGPLLWRLPSNLGRRYASLSGDRNPIHLYDVTALPLGFRHHIAHGMWSKARCLAELANRLPDAYTVSVAFKKPIKLPSTVMFGARQRGDVIDFGIASPRTQSPHVLGRVTPPLR